MNVLSVVLQVIAMTSQFGSTPSQDTLLTAHTEAAELLESAATNFALREEEYRKIANQLSKSPDFVPITHKPKQLTETAHFGFNLVYGGFNRSWIIDGDEKEGYLLYADLNANGNLLDDSPLKFELHQGKYSLLLRTTATERVDGNGQSYPVEMKLEITHSIPPGKTEPMLALNVYSMTRRKGVIQVGEKTVHFALTGSQGIYNYKYHHVYFDLNNDGELSLSESYAVWEKYVNIGNRTYEFEVDPYGRTLRLKALPQQLPSRASLEVGSQAPGFAFSDIEGKPRRLSDFKGKVVLLDFWGTWCGPCVAEAPKLATAYHQLHEKGFEIIGIHFSEDTAAVRKFISENKMSWIHTIEGDNGAIHRLYRIEGWPTYYLIGKSGNILSNSLKPGESLIKEIRKQFQEK